MHLAHLLCQEDARFWAHWNYSFDVHLDCLGQYPLLHPEFPQEHRGTAAAVAAGLISVILNRLLIWRWHSSSRERMWQPGWISENHAEFKKRKIGRRKWQSTLVLLPGGYHGQKSRRAAARGSTWPPGTHSWEGWGRRVGNPINRDRTKKKKKRGYMLCNFISTYNILK